MADGCVSKSSICHTIEGTHPDELRFIIHGETRAFNEHEAIATPVVAHVRFERVGIRLYNMGELLSVTGRGRRIPIKRRTMSPNSTVCPKTNLSVIERWKMELYKHYKE